MSQPSYSFSPLTCSPQYLDNVIGPGERYSDAYFEIPYIRTYTTQAGMVPQAAAAATPTPASTPPLADSSPTPTPTPSGTAASDLDPSSAHGGQDGPVGSSSGTSRGEILGRDLAVRVMFFLVVLLMS